MFVLPKLDFPQKIALGLLVLGCLMVWTNLVMEQQLLVLRYPGHIAGHRPDGYQSSTTATLADLLLASDAKGAKINTNVITKTSGGVAVRSMPGGRENNHLNKENNNDDDHQRLYTCSYGPDGSEKNQANRTNVTIPIHTPSFVLIGVQKSGSTAMLTYFRDHPQILQTKRRFRREGHFFDTSWQSRVLKKASELGLKQANDKHCLALELYMELFDTGTILANSQTHSHGLEHQHIFTFEKTMTYVLNPKIPARIKHTVPWSKLVLVLRNPVDRLYSHYKMTILNNHAMRKYSLEDMVVRELEAMRDKFHMTKAPLPIARRGNATNTTTLANESYEMPGSVPSDHAIPPDKWTPREMAILKNTDRGPLGKENIVRRGLYSTQLEWWLKHYTVGEDLLVINYADLLEDTKAVYERILMFVGIPLPNNYQRNDGNNYTNSTATVINFDQKVRADRRKDDRPLREDTRRYLADFYRPYNAQLEQLLGPDWSLDKLGWG